MASLFLLLVSMSGIPAPPSALAQHAMITNPLIHLLLFTECLYALRTGQSAGM